MRRAPLVAGATALGMIGILTYHPPPTSSPVLAAPKSQVQAKSPATTAPISTTTTAPPTPPGSASTTPTSTTPAPPVAQSATGPNEQYGYGTLAVKVTVSGKKITDVSVQNLQTADQYSQQLAAQVIPMLRSQVLRAQNANINGVSGATYTAQAYVTSLQAALHRLHVP
ncbi:MAG: FMN-binding protein [Acidimicrobiales bacterium]